MKELVKAAAAGLAGCVLSAPAVGGCPEPSSADMAVYVRAFSEHVFSCTNPWTCTALERFPRFGGEQASSV